MKKAVAIGIKDLKSLVGYRVVIHTGIVLECKEILCITNMCHVVFTDYSEVTASSLNIGETTIYRLSDVMDVVLDKD